MKTKRIKVNITKARSLKQSVRDQEEFIRNSYDEDWNEYISLQLSNYGTLDNYVRERIHSSY